MVPQNTLLSFTDVPKSQTLILLKSQKREVNGTLFAASVPMPKEADTQVCSQRMLGFFAHPPKKVYSRVRCLPQAIPLSSAPSTFDQPPETGIFRDTHNRCGGLGTVRFATPMPLEHLAFEPPIFIPLPEACEGVHVCRLSSWFWCTVHCVMHDTSKAIYTSAR